MTVHLKDASGTIIDTTTTDSTGQFTFQAGAGSEFVGGSGSFVITAPNGSTVEVRGTIVLGEVLDLGQITVDMPSGGIPATGAETGELLRRATMLLLVGVVLHLIARRRRERLPA